MLSVRRRKSIQAHRSKKRVISKPAISNLIPLAAPLPNLTGINKLDHELFLFYTHLLPHPAETAYRSLLTTQITSYIKSVIPNSTVKYFGSSECNLFLPSSDIDVVVFSNRMDQPLHRLARALKSASFIDQSFILHLRRARVPVIKCRDKRYAIGIDIILNNDSSTDQSEFVKDAVTLTPVLRPICLLIKYFLRSRNLHESKNGGLCSYAQFLMILSFVELHPVLQQNAVEPGTCLGTVLMDFFQLYGFDYPYEGVTISILDQCYKSQRMSNATIRIEDPVNPTFDVGNNCSQMHKIKDVFRHAYGIMSVALDSESNDSLLSLWMRFNYEEEQLREKIKQQNRITQDDENK